MELNANARLDLHIGGDLPPFIRTDEHPRALQTETGLKRPWMAGLASATSSTALFNLVTCSRSSMRHIPALTASP